MSERNNKLELLGSAPIPKALMALGIPIMIGMLINALYNLVDAYFVGGLGESQMGAISVVFPLGQVVVGLGLMFGNGAASYLSRLLGRGNKDTANRVASTALYQAWMDEYNRINNDLQTASKLEQLDYTKYLNDLNQFNTDRSFNYGQLLDEVNSQTARRSEAMNKALTAAELGDNSFLNNLGINTDNNPTDYERRYQLAQLAAQYGDYSGLRELGINPDAAALNRFNTTAAGKSSSRGSRSSGGGGNTTPQETETTGLSAQDIAALKAAYGTSIDADTWNGILQSNPGITEAMLTQAGFTKSGGDSGGGNVSGVTDYDSAIAYMKAAGVDGSVRSGLMTKSEWSRRKTSLQQYGTGGTEVKNYNSYADYIKDYCEYAASK